MERAALGKRIRESRISKGYTQQDLADRAEIGVVYVSEIERGIKMPSLNIFIKIVDALDISADFVFEELIRYLHNNQYVLLNGLEANGIKELCPTQKEVRAYTNFINDLYNFFEYDYT